ncbi:unnamed protein product, partial [Sphagnum balticum]
EETRTAGNTSGRQTTGAVGKHIGAVVASVSGEIEADHTEDATRKQGLAESTLTNRSDVEASLTGEAGRGGTVETERVVAEGADGWRGEEVAFLALEAGIQLTAEIAISDLSGAKVALVGDCVEEEGVGADAADRKGLTLDTPIDGNLAEVAAAPCEVVIVAALQADCETGTLLAAW